jgi:HKD family nuclease
MRVIVKAPEIDNVLVDLMDKYQNYRIATAWASLGSKASKKLLANKKRINKMIVGTHFYQTNPEFIFEFIDSKQVKFILNTSGIYHPKVYLFSNSRNEWECLIGSANFTASALLKNTEIVVHLSCADDGSGDIYKTLVAEINTYWDDAESMTAADYHNYKNIWDKNRRIIKVLEDKYGKSKKSKPLTKSNIFSLSWPEYFSLIQDDNFHSFAGRIKLLKTARSYFLENKHFADMKQIERRELAGIASKKQSKSDLDWGWFGSMVGAGKFQNRINENNAFISRALDVIPMQGNIYKSDYESFVKLFKKAFSDGGSGIAIASRLLAMKRPDCFVCLDKQNTTELCSEFGISKSVSFETYWDDIIERIHNSVWCLSEKPTVDAEAEAWFGRVAMLDAIFYQEKEK